MELEFQSNYALAPLTWWKVGGAAEYFFEPDNKLSLKAGVQRALNEKLPITVLGGGSNVLVDDDGISGLVISTRKLRKLEVQKTDRKLLITAEAGLPKAELLKIFLQNKLAPALFLSGIPGDVGGGVVMNAGVSVDVKPIEFCEIVDWVEVIDLNSSPIGFKMVTSAQLEWSYRKSKGWQPGIITSVGLSWPLQEEDSIAEKVKQLTLHRRRTQPLNFPSCGSVFRNPKNLKAGQLIEECGLKGFRIGGAQVSDKHANFIINLGAASALDIKAVIDHVRDRVFASAGVVLETEVVFLGSGLHAIRE